MPRGHLTSAFPRSAILAANGQVALFLSRPVPTEPLAAQRSCCHSPHLGGSAPALGHGAAASRQLRERRSPAPARRPLSLSPGRTAAAAGGGGGERYCGAARPPPAARRGRCGGAAGRAGPAAPFAGGGRPLLAAGGSAAARTIGRPLAARGRGGLRRVSLLLSSWSFESFTNGSSLKREKVWEQRCTWRCPRFPLLLQSPVPVPHGSPPLLHLFQFRQIYAF